MRWVLGWSRNPDNKFIEYKAAGHGTDMFAVEKNLEPMVLDWFDAHLRNAPEKPAGRRRLQAVADRGVLEHALRSGRRRQGAGRCTTTPSARGSKTVLFPENETNLLGYQLLQEGNAKDAVEVFKLNVEAYPASANTYDSLSDAYLALGNTDEALRYAEQAIAMLAKDVEAPDNLKNAGAGERGEEGTHRTAAKAVTASRLRRGDSPVRQSRRHSHSIGP